MKDSPKGSFAFPARRTAGPLHQQFKSAMVAYRRTTY
jgi:hypothetical protein